MDAYGAKPADVVFASAACSESERGFHQTPRHSDAAPPPFGGLAHRQPSRSREGGHPQSTKYTWRHLLPGVVVVQYMRLRCVALARSVLRATCGRGVGEARVRRRPLGGVARTWAGKLEGISEARRGAHGVIS